MLLPLLLFGQTVSVDAAIADYRMKTRAEVPCTRPSGDDEIVICSRRDADRYRTPLLVESTDRGAPAARMERLLSPEASGYVPCGKGAFMAKCGSVGIGVTASASGKTDVSTKLRPLAP